MAASNDNIAANSKWDDDRLQFARLLCEICATQAMDLNDVAVSMDITLDELDELFERAHNVWAKSKAEIKSGSPNG